MDPGVLAALAGNALAAAVVTDGWLGLRHKVAAWFRRRTAADTTESWLARTEEQLVAAAEAGKLEQVQADLATTWRVRFADVLDAYPDAVGELEALTRELQAAAPAMSSASDHSAAAGRDMTAWADRGSNAANVVHGNMTAGPTSPGPAKG
jgi:hypothetical protein